MPEQYRLNGLPSYIDRSTLRARVRNVTFSIFTINMGTAGLAFMLDKIPSRYRFEGLETIGVVVVIFDLVLFVIFNIAIITRFSLYPRAILTCLRHPVESSYVCAYAQACATAMVNISVYAPPKVGSWINTVLLVLYFLQIFTALTLSVTLPLVHFGITSRKGNLKHMPPSWLLLPTVVTYIASLAYNIAAVLPASQAIYVLWTGYAMLGIGLLLTIFYFALWWTSLAMNGLPRGRYALTPFMIVGMSSFIAGGFLGLGHSAERVFRLYSELNGKAYSPGSGGVFGDDLDASAGGDFNLINICLGLLFYGWSWWALLIACTMSLAIGLQGPEGSFTPSISGFWSLAFPTTGIIVDTWAVSEAIGTGSAEAGIRWMDIIGLIMLVIWLCAYIFAWTMAILKIYRKESFFEGKDENKPETECGFYLREFHEASDSEKRLAA